MFLGIHEFTQSRPLAALEAWPSAKVERLASTDLGGRVGASGTSAEGELTTLDLYKEVSLVGASMLQLMSRGRIPSLVLAAAELLLRISR